MAGSLGKGSAAIASSSARWAVASARCQASAHSSGAGRVVARRGGESVGIGSHHQGGAGGGVPPPGRVDHHLGDSTVGCQPGGDRLRRERGPEAEHRLRGQSGRACPPWPAGRPRRARHRGDRRAGPTGGRPAPGSGVAVASPATASASTGERAPTTATTRLPPTRASTSATAVRSGTTTPEATDGVGVVGGGAGSPAGSTRSSSKGRLRWTGPGGTPIASAQAWAARRGHRCRRSRSRHRPLVEPADGVAVQLHLVDGLRGTDVAQPVGAVGGQHQQRHPRQVRLDHGRVVLGGGGPGRTHQGDRATRRLGDPQGEETGAPLVDHAPVGDPGVGGEGGGQRGVARPRGDHRIGDPQVGESADEGGGEAMGGDGGVHLAEARPSEVARRWGLGGPHRTAMSHQAKSHDTAPLRPGCPPPSGHR